MIFDCFRPKLMVLELHEKRQKRLKMTFLVFLIKTNLNENIGKIYNNKKVNFRDGLNFVLSDKKINSKFSLSSIKKQRKFFTLQNMKNNYYDLYKKDFVKFTQSKGIINPKLWNDPTQPKKQKRKTR